MMMMEGRGGVYLSVFYGVGPVVYKHTVPFLAGSGLDTVPIVPPSSLPAMQPSGRIKGPILYNFLHLYFSPLTSVEQPCIVNYQKKNRS